VRALANGMTYATFMGAIVFVTVYARRHWRTSGIGINLMLLGVVVAIESGLALSTVVFGVHWPHRDAVRAFAWFLVAFTLWHRVLLVLRMPRARPPTVDELVLEREQLRRRLAEVDRALLAYEGS
jgi:membrane-associated phospholipid phosphatase